MWAADVIVIAFLAYAGLGILFAAWFVSLGVGRFDPAAREAPVGFRLLILPGVAALWPLMATRYAARRRATQGNAP